MTPYRRQKRVHFWRTATQKSAEKVVDGLYTPKFGVSPGEKIATAGSCFAQHVRSHLIEQKLNFLDMELPPPFLPKIREKKYGYGLFSARFGNIYTTAQLHQLAQRAFGEFETDEPFWEKEGRFFDPLRSTIEPLGFASLAEAESSRASHLRQVAKLFLEMDVLVFTLGLTEAWVSRSDGTVFPLCPGVSAGEFDNRKYAFKNFNITEVVECFEEFRAIVKRCNPGVRFILTVSPVALEATASEQNVILATTYSKSVLRAAAGHLFQTYNDIDYFPSYEIFTSPAFRMQYFEENMRDPAPEGVSQAMRLFFTSHDLNTLTDGDKMAAADENPANAELSSAKKRAEQFEAEQQVICDEMLLGAENRDA